VDRIVQVMLIGGIAAVIGGSLLCEFYIEPWLRRRRVRRRYRHAVEMLAAYRSLRAQLRARRLSQVMAVLNRFIDEDAKVMVGPNGKIIVATGAVFPVECGEQN
jgi:hypothetical protein